MSESGEGDVVDLNSKILMKIHDEIRHMRGDLQTLEGETIKGFTAVAQQIERAGAAASGAYRTLEVRVATLEGDVAKLKRGKGSTRRRPGPPKR